MPAVRLDRHEHPAAAIFGGILDQVAEHLVEVLPLDPDLRLLVAGDVDGDVLVEPVDGALRPPRALSQTGARAWAEARRPIARARARWWSTWRRIAVASRQTVSARSGAVRGGGVGDHGQRRLQRMGEVAGVAPRFLGLLLAMGEQLR